MNNQINALKKELHRTKEQKRELSKQLAIASLKLDFPQPNPFVQHWHDAKYDKENWITTLAWDTFDFDSGVFAEFLSGIKKISVALHNSIRQNGFDYEIRLPYESYSCTYGNATAIEFDGDWSRIHSLVIESLTDEETDMVKDLVFDFGSALVDEILKILEDNNIEKEDYCHFIDESFLVQGLVKIKNTETLETNLGRLCAIDESQDIDIWNYLHQYKGSLVGKRQIQNYEHYSMLNGKDFFVLQ